MAKKPTPKGSMKARFEKSGADKDKGTKEGSAADMARDKKQFALFKKKPTK